MKDKTGCPSATRSEDPGAKPTAAHLAEMDAIFDLHVWRDVSPAIYLQWPIIGYMCKKKTSKPDKSLSLTKIVGAGISGRLRADAEALWRVGWPRVRVFLKANKERSSV